MFAVISRGLSRNCRRGCTSLPIINSRSGRNKYCYFNIRNSSRSRYAFSTIPFDGNDAFTSSNASEPSTYYLQSPSLKVEQSCSTQNNTADIPKSDQQFQQQIELWIATNPRIAAYKGEESLAKLWVEQQEIFRQWEQQQTGTSTASQPAILLTTESVNLVLHAWCLSNNGEVSAERAERLLHWMEDLHTSSSEWSSCLPKPNYQSYATVIDAWSRAAIYESNHPTSEVLETESGGRTKKNVVSSATKAGFECAKRAEEVLMHMQKMHEQLQQDEGYNSDIQPDTRVFNLVLKAWSKIQGGTKSSAIRAMRILDLMQELHHQESMHASEWQGIVLNKVQPNLQTYKLLLQAWAHATHTVDGPDRAEEILRHLLSLSKAGNNLGVEIYPDAECFHIVMRAHAENVRKKGKGDDGLASVERARKVVTLLDWMEMLALRSKIQTTIESYRIALSAWVWSHHVDAPKEAERILYRMIRVHDMNSTASGKKTKSDAWVVQPETRDFNTVINCCSFARKVGVDRSEEDDEQLLQRQIEHREVYNIALGVFHTLISSTYAQPDSASFAGIIRASVNLLPNTDERDDIVIEHFRLAYKTEPSDNASSTSVKMLSTSSERMKAPPGAGCVDANVLRQLRSALPSTEDYIRVREEFEEYRRKNVSGE